MLTHSILHTLMVVVCAVITLAHLVAAVTLVGFLSTVNPLVSLQVVALDEPHVTHVTPEWLLTCSMRKHTHTQFQKGEFIFDTILNGF